MLGVVVISLSSKKKFIVTLSTIELEFIAYAKVYGNNNSSFKLYNNTIMQGKRKHIDVRFHYMHDLTK